LGLAKERAVGWGVYERLVAEMTMEKEEEYLGWREPTEIRNDGATVRGTWDEERERHMLQSLRRMHCYANDSPRSRSSSTDEPREPEPCVSPRS